MDIYLIILPFIVAFMALLYLIYGIILVCFHKIFSYVNTAKNYKKLININYINYLFK